MGGHAQTLKLNLAQFYVYARNFIHRLYFIYARKFYALTQPKVMRQWKSTFSCLFWNAHVNLPNETFVIVSARALISSNVAYCKTIKSI